LTWVIDPIDGTRAFITGSPLWGILIALSDDEGPLIGVLDQPFLGERFAGVCSGDRREAFYHRAARRERLQTRDCSGLSHAQFSTTTPEMFNAPERARVLAAIRSSVQLTRFGGDCYQYGQIALGFLDLVVEADLKPFDIHALIPIIEGAGGVVTTWEGGKANQGGRVVAAGDARVHKEALALIQKALG
jgi:myo-inositol-1(or 4)-monophosphatase